MYESDYGAAAAASLGALWVVYLIVAVVLLVSMWKIFTKAGYEGWKSIIPIYNLYCLYKMTWGNGWMFLLLLVPFVNAVIAIITVYKLATAFNKGVGYFFGLFFLSIIFYPMLAFSNAQYVGIKNNSVNTNIIEA